MSCSDKIAAARRKGKWSGGHPLLGYDVDPHTRKLLVNEAEAVRVREIFQLYLEHQALMPVLAELRAAWLAQQALVDAERPGAGRAAVY